MIKRVELMFDKPKYLNNMAIKRVWLDESENECISCGACETACPQVFEVPDKMVIKAGVDFNQYEAEILDAVDGCPTEVIKYE
jgi:ferredoxin